MKLMGMNKKERGLLVDDDGNPIAVSIEQEPIYPNLFIALKRTVKTQTTNNSSYPQRTATQRFLMSRSTDVIVESADTR